MHDTLTHKMPIEAPPMWPHQVEAVDYIRHRAGTMIVGWMGTGKSRIVVEAAKALAARRVLIVCPKAVFVEWPKQFTRYALDARVVVPDGKVAERCAVYRLAFASEPFRVGMVVAVVNYDVLYREEFAAWFDEETKWRGQFDLIVFDESHKIKEPSGQAARAAAKMRKGARRVVCMTGTPAPNSPMDVFAQYRVVNPGVFGPNLWRFRSRYAVMGGYGGKQIVNWIRQDEMRERMATCTYTIPREVLSWLPEQTTVQRTCELSDEGRRAYNAMKKQMAAEFAEGVLTASNAAVRTMRLAQITGGTVTLEDGTVKHVCRAKRALLAEVLAEVGDDEPVVVFCRFKADLDAVHEVCRAAGWSSRELSGSRNELAQWQAGEARVLAVQIAAGGAGVDLTRARFAVYYSIGYSRGEYEQARARTHRPGQAHPVVHVELVAQGTVDAAVYRALASKADVVDAVLAEIVGGKAAQNRDVAK